MIKPPQDHQNFPGVGFAACRRAKAGTVAAILGHMANFNGYEQRVLALPREIWDEIDERTRAFRIRSEAAIREALHTYFDLVGPVRKDILMSRPGSDNRTLA